MSFGTLALICLCGLAGPLISAGGRGMVPVVVGELLAGVAIGRTGLEAIDPTDPTLTFLYEIGFLMLMFQAGMSVPLRDPGLSQSIGRGTRAALLVAALAVGAGLLLSQLAGAGHAAVYAVLVASGSAAVVLPILQERSLSDPVALTVMAQVTVADVAATVAVPLVLDPSRTGKIVAGSAAVAGCVLAMLFVARRLRGLAQVHELRMLGRRRHWAIDLRLALIVLFGLAWLTQRSGASLLIAGFGSGLMVASIGGPKRLSNEVLGIAGGFFIPLFFVVLGARLDLRGLFSDAELVAFAAVLVALNVLVHVLAARLLRLPRAAGLVATAQLGVPSAIVALGLPLHVLTGPQAAAIIVAALASIAVCSLGAAGMARAHG
ncbi:MAG TPA: cation:proton antiporter [Solirubrobacteraceae bacterium]|jgi:Kef-type K+ transport system membrane component KefB|nr:cation:proton antiporter [Solirubrobacteraceae bacterium]